MNGSTTNRAWTDDPGTIMFDSRLDEACAVGASLENGRQVNLLDGKISTKYCAGSIS